MRKIIVIAIIAAFLAITIYSVFVADGRGQALYNQHCSACHARGIAGAPIFGDKDAWASRIVKGMDVLYASALNGLNGMPPKGGKMEASDDEIKIAVDYMVSQSSR
ncbi:MAG: cytochrome c5 family protein [Gammaproteobacteria bacterium]|nr:cytochrome c5 family protein [Gammaproteobacteria bacterium]